MSIHDCIDAIYACFEFISYFIIKKERKIKEQSKFSHFLSEQSVILSQINGDSQ
jgi:hypothetical protein